MAFLWDGGPLVMAPRGPPCCAPAGRPKKDMEATKKSAETLSFWGLFTTFTEQNLQSINRAVTEGTMRLEGPSELGQHAK